MKKPEHKNASMERGIGRHTTVKEKRGDGNDEGTK